MEYKSFSLADQVFEKLETDILSGVYKNGEILTELKLCEELGVSRTPVREALRKLSQEHIIEETQKGSVVIGIDKQDLIDIYLIREKIEGICAVLSAKNATEEQIKELEETLDLQRFYTQKGDAEKIRKADNRFHELIYASSGSHVLYDTLVPLHKKVQKYRKISVQSPLRAKKSFKEHSDIFEAIRWHDEAAAEKSMNEHIANAFRHITEGK